jgi:hypothetical protein
MAVYEEEKKTSELPPIPLSGDVLAFVANSLLNKRKAVYRAASCLCCSTVASPKNAPHDFYIELPSLEVPRLPRGYLNLVDTHRAAALAVAQAPLERMLSARARRKLRERQLRRSTVANAGCLDGVPYDPNDFRFPKREAVSTEDKPSDGLESLTGQYSPFKQDEAGIAVKSPRRAKQLRGKKLAYFMKSKRQRGQLQNERLQYISSHLKYQRELASSLSDLVPGQNNSASTQSQADLPKTSVSPSPAVSNAPSPVGKALSGPGREGKRGSGMHQRHSHGRKMAVKPLDECLDPRSIFRQYI